METERALGILLDFKKFENTGFEEMHKVVRSTAVSELERLKRSGLRVDAVDENGRTCLFVAAAAGEDEVVEWLLDNGADVAAIDPSAGRTPLHAASAVGHVAVVARLLGAGANSTALDGAGQTAAEVAHDQQHLDVVRVFLEHSRTELRDAHLERARAKKRIR